MTKLEIQTLLRKKNIGIEFRRQFENALDQLSPKAVEVIAASVGHVILVKLSQGFVGGLLVGVISTWMVMR